MYLCRVENPWTYTGLASTTLTLSGDNAATVELFGRRVPADVGVVRRLFAEQRTPPERQVALWAALWRQWPDPFWGEACLGEAERVQELLRREAALAVGAPAVAAPSPSALSAATADAHFVWLGDRHGVLVDHLRDGIAALAAAGLVGADRQDDLRRALGLCVNDAERRTAAVPVPWLGPVDMLWLLVDQLWALGLITCAGGRQQKWRTATAAFRRPDGSRFDLTLKNSRCTNAAKRALMGRALLGGLRRIVGTKA